MAAGGWTLGPPSVYRDRVHTEEDITMATSGHSLNPDPGVALLDLVSRWLLASCSWTPGPMLPWPLTTGTNQGPRPLRSPTEKQQLSACRITALFLN